jgi:hypothetical protein
VISGNISEFHKGPTYAHTAAKFGKDRANKQAVAVALSEARRSGHAAGGGVIPLARQVGGPINPAMLRPPMPGMAPPGNVMPMGVAGPANMPFMRPPGRAGGGFNIAKGPNLSPPNYFERGEARDMMQHGPIVSTSPGRADTHFMRVPSGSYVLPSQTVAGLGSGNSLAGLKIANNIFGLNGPYGISNPKFGHGPGAPRPPRGIAFATGGHTSEGGARGHDDHKPVDVMLSGGEFVVHSGVVHAIGQGSIENGHKILDHFVLLHRKRDIKRQKALPPPAKK